MEVLPPENDRAPAQLFSANTVTRTTMPSHTPTRTRFPQFFLAMVFALAIPAGCDEDGSDTDSYDSDSDSDTDDTDTDTETPDAGESHGGISDPEGEIRDSTNCLKKPCEDD